MSEVKYEFASHGDMTPCHFIEELLGSKNQIDAYTCPVGLMDTIQSELDLAFNRVLCAIEHRYDKELGYIEESNGECLDLCYHVKFDKNPECKLNNK